MLCLAECNRHLRTAPCGSSLVQNMHALVVLYRTLLLLLLLLHVIVPGGHTGHKTMQDVGDDTRFILTRPAAQPVRDK
jgi:hypothetical protein